MKEPFGLDGPYWHTGRVNYAVLLYGEHAFVIAGAERKGPESSAGSRRIYPTAPPTILWRGRAFFILFTTPKLITGRY